MAARRTTAAKATAPATKPATRTRRTKAAAEVEVETPAAKATPGAKGTAWLVEFLDTKGIETNGLNVRNVLRRLAASGEIDHDRQSRYEFTGPNDPIVRAVLAHFKGTAKVAPAPAAKAPAKKAAAKAPAKAPATRGRRKAAPAPEPEVEDVEDFEDDDDLEEL